MEFEYVRVSEEEFSRWKAQGLYHRAQTFTIADCQNFYDDKGLKIARHSFGGYPNIYEIRSDYLQKEVE